MTSKEKITDRITGDPTEKARRDALAAEIFRAFERGGAEDVQSLVATKMDQLRESINELLRKLNGQL